MATVSRLRAIAVLGTLRVAGFPAWVLWLLVDLMTLTGFKNRLSVLFNWTVAFLGRGRPQRVITAQQVFARHALEAYPREGLYCRAVIHGRSRRRADHRARPSVGWAAPRESHADPRDDGNRRDHGGAPGRGDGAPRHDCATSSAADAPAQSAPQPTATRSSTEH